MHNRRNLNCSRKANMAVDDFAIAQIAKAQRSAFLSAYETRATMDSAFTLARRDALAFVGLVVGFW